MAAGALKNRVKSFFSGLQSKAQNEEEKDEEIHALQPPDLPHTREDPRRTEEIIEEIDKVYFKEADFDCSEQELKGMEPEVDLSRLEDRIFSLKTQDNARVEGVKLIPQTYLDPSFYTIYRKIYDLVFANYTAYVQELENVTMLQVSLQQAATRCVDARRQLTEARKGVSHGGLGLLAKHRRRERLRALLDILRTLKTLQRTDARLKELLQEGDYPSATQICIECQDVIQTYKHYSCVREMSASLQDIQSDIEHELEEALGKLCSRFNADNYEQVQEAYRKLGKTQTAVDTLLMKFTTTVHDTAYAVVLEHVKFGNTVSRDESGSKMNYSNLCKLITGEQFIPCLMEICFAVWRILYNYHQVRECHGSADKGQGRRYEGQEQNEEAFNRNYVQTKLDNGLLRVWRDVQQKVRPYLLATDLSQFKYDDFLRVLEIVNRLIAVGVEFCGEGSDSLQQTMRQQSLKYFKNYHRGRLEELKLFLENEAWEPCPVRSSFTIQKLREFRFLRAVPTSPASSVDSFNKIHGTSLFTRYSFDDNPFSEEEQEEEGEDVIEYGGLEDTLSDDERMDDDDEKEEEKKVGSRLSVPAYRRHHSASTQRGPLLSNTTLTVLRFFGNYIQMMNALQTIASDVLECLSQLFDYYLFAVYKFFAVDLLHQNKDDIQLSTKLTTTLTRIEETIISQDAGVHSVIMTSDGGVKVPNPSTSPIVELNDSDNLYGLQYRMVAVESLIFLASQFVELMPYLMKYVQESKRSFLEQFLSHTVKTVQELRRPVYHGIASRAVPFDQVLQLMGSVKWEIREIMSQHSGYVDRLLREFTKFRQKTEAIDRKVHFPMEANNMLWERAILLSNRMFVEGFSQAKKCSNEGRALMQVDFQQFRTQMEKMSNIRPLPHHSYVEDYIKAYYLSEADTEDWIRKHHEYTAKQMHSLITVGVGSRSGKKSRQRLLAIVDEIDRHH